MFLSREIDINCVNTKIYINNRVKRIIFSKYTSNLKTTISHRSRRTLGLLLLLFEFNIFSFIKDKIENITYTPISRDQYQYTPTNDSSVYWSRDTGVYMYLVLRLVVYLLNIIRLSLLFLYKILYI